MVSFACFQGVLVTWTKNERDDFQKSPWTSRCEGMLPGWLEERAPRPLYYGWCDAANSCAGCTAKVALYCSRASCFTGRPLLDKAIKLLAWSVVYLLDLEDLGPLDATKIIYWNLVTSFYFREEVLEFVTSKELEDLLPIWRVLKFTQIRLHISW